MQPDEPVLTDAMNTDIFVRLEQIAKVSQNARTSWFALLALLVFVGGTLMSHKDSDFFAFGAETELPLVSISVPTVSFFIAAPALMAALYVYLHFYLHGLWVALAKCSPRVGEEALEERIYPTMLGTSALAIRRRWRRETGNPVEGSRTASIAISFMAVWVLGPVVLCFLWWRSMPFHHEWLTLSVAAWLWIALIAGGNSLLHLFCLMRTGERYPHGLFRRPLARPTAIISLVLLVVLAIISWDTTEGGRFVPLARANLAGAELTRKPADWLHYDIWIEDWKHQFRIRECLNAAQVGGSCADDKRDQLKRETQQRWTTRTDSLDAANLPEADLRMADLRFAFLSGANFGPKWAIPGTRPLIGARLDGADIREARLERANFKFAQLKGTELSNARLQGTHFYAARLEGANFRSARLQGANFSSAGLQGVSFTHVQGQNVDFAFAHGEGADFTQAQLDSANFPLARLPGADFTLARMEGANFSSGRLERATFHSAWLKGADFSGAQLEGADFASARLQGADFALARLKGANFNNARLEGANFKFARLEGADLRHVQGLGQSQLHGACGNQDTQLPQGLSLLDCRE